MIVYGNFVKILVIVLIMWIIINVFVRLVISEDSVMLILMIVLINFVIIMVCVLIWWMVIFVIVL